MVAKRQKSKMPTAAVTRRRRSARPPRPINEAFERALGTAYFAADVLAPLQALRYVDAVFDAAQTPTEHAKAQAIFCALTARTRQRAAFCRARRIK